MHSAYNYCSFRQLPLRVLQRWCPGLAGLPGQVLLGVHLPDLSAADEAQLRVAALSPPLGLSPDAGDPEQRPPGRVEAALHDRNRD